MTRNRFATFTFILMAGISGAGLQGCGDKDEPGNQTPATTTPTPTVTPTATVAEHTGPPHSIMRVGSTQANGGKLTVNEVPTAFVIQSACLGGSGDACTGGIIVYSETSPGFNDLLEENPALPIYKLPDGVEVRFELTRGDVDASITISDNKLETAGQTAVVNTTPHLHNHPVWQFVAAADVVHPPDKQLSFRLHANGYESSDEITVDIKLFEDDDHHDDGSHD